MTHSGVAFMMTRAMKSALRARGFGDVDIENMRPDEARKILLTPDERAVRSFLEAFVALAIGSLDGHSPPGCLQMCRKHPSDTSLVPTRYHLDSADLVDRMTHDALADSSAGHNVYLEGRLVSFGLKGKQRSGLADTSAVFALVVDSDADKNMSWDPPAGVRPTLTVRTSPNNHQYWFFFEHALAPGYAQQLGEDLRQATKADSDTGNRCNPIGFPARRTFPTR
jgi:hypothetical protein